MSVNVEFVPDGRHGVVAEGTYLWDAAKRLGLRLPAECEGRGECDTCAVIVREGATLLSTLTDAERERLSPARLAAGERLAFQQKLTTLVELEAITATQTFKAIAAVPTAFFDKGVDLLVGFGRSRARREKQARRPAEHVAGTRNNTKTGSSQST